MKKLMLTAGVIVMGLSTTLAQQVDSTKSRTREQSQRKYENSDSKGSRVGTTDSKRNRNETSDSKRSTNGTSDQARRNGGMNDQSTSPQREMVVVQPTDIPASLRQTLQDPKYQGWEDAIIYHNTRTGEYLVSPRPHRFTSEGQEIAYGKNEWGKNRTSGMNSNGNRSGQSMNQHRRGSESRENNSDGSNTYSTNPTQDSTGVNATQSSSSPEQQNSQGQSNSYRRDSTGMNGNSTNRDSSGTSMGNTNPNNKYTTNRISDQDVPTEGMVLVEENQIPENLKTTLRGSDYSGWQQGKIYHNPATGEYILIMGGAESGTDNQRSYRFDKDGKVIKGNGTNRGQ